jgi:hypothetical protein
MMMATSPSKAALEYLALGFSVIPVSRDKKPYVAWAPFQRALPMDLTVKDWWQQWPDANVAIVAGRISGLVVFDSDSEKAEQFIKNQGGLPVCPQSVTAKGRHYFFKHPGFEVRPDVNKKRNLDIRGDAAYVVAPPSIHETGHVYEWAPGLRIHEIDPPEMRPWQLEYVKKHCGISADGQGENPKNWEVSYLKGVRKGERNAVCAKLAGLYLHWGLRPIEVFFLLIGWNTRNRPPLCAQEISTTVKSIAKTHRRNTKVVSTGGNHAGIGFSVDRRSQENRQQVAAAG